MTAERGGIAAKLGERYEGFCVAGDLIRLAQGDIRALSVELAGDDERGVDYWIESKDGTRISHQCKRANSAQGAWRISDLCRRKVLRDSQFQLERDARHQFVFVSGDSAAELEALCFRAKHSPTPDLFWSEKIRGSEHEKSLRAYCGGVGLDCDAAEGRAAAFGMLERTTVTVSRDDRRARAQLEFNISLIFQGEAKAIIGALCDLAAERLGRTIYQDDVLQYLRERGYESRNLANHPRLPELLDTLNDEYVRAVRPYLIDGEVIARQEATEITNLATAAEAPDIVLVHGRGGMGKTGVLLYVVERLRKVGVPLLALKLDLRPPKDNPHSFGKACGLPESPAQCLSALTRDRRGVLILDQLDALRWTAAHGSASWETATSLIEAAAASRNLTVIVACRTFDLSNDPRFVAWRTEHKPFELEVGELCEADVSEVVKRRGGDLAAFSPRQRTVLASPLNLSIWSKLPTERRDQLAFGSGTALMRALWADLRKSLRGSLGEDGEPALTRLIDYMDRESTRSAPSRLLDKFPSAADRLASLNVIHIDSETISFIHQSYADYLIAEKIAEVGGAESVVDWVKRTDQSLFRREQLRCILELLSEERPRVFISSISELVADSDVRFHIKHLALQVMANQSRPRPAEVRQVVDWLNDETRRDHVLKNVLWGRAPWIDAMHDAGRISDWLFGADIERRESALSLLESVARYRGDLAARLLREGWKQGVLGGADAARIFRFASDPETESADLFALRLYLLRNDGPVESLLLLSWERVSQNRPCRAIQLLRGLMDRVAGDMAVEEGATSRRFADRADYIDKSVAIAASARPIATLKTLVPGILAIERENQSVIATKGPYASFWRFKWKLPSHELSGAFISPVVRALQRLAGQCPPLFEEWLGQFAASGCQPLGVATLRALAIAPLDVADIALRCLIDHPELFEIREDHYATPFALVRKVIQRHSPACTNSVSAKLQATILALRPSSESQAVRDRQDRCGDNAVAYANIAGQAQHALLSAFPSNRLTDAARGRGGELQRKYGPYVLLPPFPETFHYVGSSLGARASRLSDAAWIALVNRRVERKERGSGGGHVCESSHEVFATDYQRLLMKEPERYISLACQFPVTATPYLRVTFSAIWQLAQNGIDLPEDKVRHLASKIGPDGEASLLRELCSAIQKTPEWAWDRATIDALAKIAAEHHDPSPGDFAMIHSSSDGNALKPDLFGSSINCVRGQAARAITALLWKRPEILESVRPALWSAAADRHPAVRITTHGACLALFNDRPADAMSLLRRACDTEDDGVLDSPELSQLIAHARYKHPELITALLNRMAASDVADVAKVGGAWITAINVDQQLADAELQKCFDGEVSARTGIAETAANWYRYADVTANCATLLSRSFNDRDENVRSAARLFLRVVDGDEVMADPALLRAFVASRAFLDNPSDFFEALSAYKGSLLPIVSSVLDGCRILCGLKEGNAFDLANHARHSGSAASVLLRAYEQAEAHVDLEAREACLDAWDALLAGGAFNAAKQLEAIGS